MEKRIERMLVSNGTQKFWVKNQKKIKYYQGLATHGDPSIKIDIRKIVYG